MPQDSSAEVASLADRREFRARFPNPPPTLSQKQRRTARKGIAKARRELDRAKRRRAEVEVQEAAE